MKHVLLGIWIGLIIGAILAWKFKPIQRYFVMPESIISDKAVKYRIPDDLYCCKSIILDNKGGIHLEYKQN